MSVKNPFTLEEAYTVVVGDQDDGDITYMFDAMHFPAPVSKLYQSLMGPAFERGFTAAAKALQIPIAGSKVTFHHNYLYNAFLPVIPRSDEEERTLEARAEASMKAQLPIMMERWENEHLPRIKEILHRLETMNFTNAVSSFIPTLLDEVAELSAELWTIHFQIAMPCLMASQLFDELYADLLGGNEQDGHALLVGLPSESRKAGAGLSDLAAAAKVTGLDKLLLSTPANEVMAALAEAPKGEYYAAAIRDYLNEYGLRQDLFDFMVPTWQENPSIAISNIQAYLRSGHDARADHERALTSAVTALNAARARIASYPEAVRGQFEAMLIASRNASFLQEEHNFHIDQRSNALVRLLFLKLGARLVKTGVLARADDVFMLTVDELKSVSSRPLTEQAICDTRILVLERETDLDHSARIVPPPFVGAAPSGPPPADNPMQRATARFFGGQVAGDADPGQIKGNAGSRGAASGIARVARTLDEAKSLQPGEILVAITTMPAWTPLFGTAAAVVTETGGPLSHCAIVAREYGIPAVVGATGATRLIKTGQWITVDGTSGVITIDES